MTERKYYHSYDDRYRQVHEKDLLWNSGDPSPIVTETMEEFGILRRHKLLEIGCGEGRDAYPLLRRGFDLLATDVSPEAIAFCQRRMPDVAEHFRVLDCITEKLGDTFDFIYAVAVVHMLVPDADRNAFYSFIREHLTPNGIALICTMGDGHTERKTDIRTAFEIQERVHPETGQTVRIASTSCRTVSFQTLENELKQNGLTILKQGITSVPGFPQMMFAAVRGH